MSQMNLIFEQACLTFDEEKENGHVRTRPCDESDQKQRWEYRSNKIMTVEVDHPYKDTPSGDGHMVQSHWTHDAMATQPGGHDAIPLDA